MAIFGNINTVKEQVSSEKFKKAFEYLESVFQDGNPINKRLLNLEVGAFEKVELDDYNFALEQVYYSKNREECFFESHKRYIDVQFIVDGEEIIEVCDIDSLTTSQKYDESIDLIKYQKTNKASIIKLKKGDVAIFYPQDAHMPCVKINNPNKIVKTVVKVAV